MEELVPVFSKITNQVLLDHYAKEMAKELNLSEETVFSMLKKTPQEREEELENTGVEESVQIKRQQADAYFISLLLKTPIELAKEFSKKLKKEDFASSELSDIFEEVSDYIAKRKTSINIKSLISKFNEEKGKMVSELYLWDLEGKDEEDEKLIAKELQDMVDRIGKDSLKRQLKSLSEEIKIAETRKEEEEVERLTKRFEKLSKGLL